MTRAKCACKSDIRLNDTGRFLLHYTLGPGIGMICAGTGKTPDELRAEAQAS